MSSVSEGKKCETDGFLCSEVEVTDETLDSSSDKMMCANEKETFLEWRERIMIFFSCKSLLNGE